jgi:hypothetical protein
MKTIQPNRVKWFLSVHRVHARLWKVNGRKGGRACAVEIEAESAGEALLRFRGIFK